MAVGTYCILRVHACTSVQQELCRIVGVVASRAVQRCLTVLLTENKDNMSLVVRLECASKLLLSITLARASTSALRCSSSLITSSTSCTLWSCSSRHCSHPNYSITRPISIANTQGGLCTTIYTCVNNGISSYGFAVTEDTAHGHEIQAQNGHHHGRHAAVAVRVGVLARFQQKPHDVEVPSPCGSVKRRSAQRAQVEVTPTTEFCLSLRLRVRRWRPDALSWRTR